jgi:FKBP-type peptidyl-prolyl cis-trans isomerase FkpA
MRLVFVALALAALFACSEGESGAGSTAAGSPPGGLQVVHEREGTGRSPSPSDVVEVHYHGTFPDGQVFDSSVERGEPARFPLNRVIPCWTQGLQQMKVGGKAKLTCPPELAYGAAGAPPTIPPNATLVFEVELLAIE